MTAIRVNTEQLRNVGSQLRASNENLVQIEYQLRQAADSLDAGTWEGHSRSQIEPLLEQVKPGANSVTHYLDEFAYKLFRVADIFEGLDTKTADEIDKIPWDWSLLTEDFEGPSIMPPSDTEESVDEAAAEGDGEELTFEDAFGLIEDLLVTIDWASNSAEAAKKFQEILKQIGRILNALTGKRGYVKQMELLGEIFGGVGAVGKEFVEPIGNLFALKDFAEYFSGNMTNQEMARKAVEILIPIPFLDGIIADWMASNVADPDGKWRGLVTEVQ